MSSLFALLMWVVDGVTVFPARFFRVGLFFSCESLSCLPEVCSLHRECHMCVVCLGGVMRHFFEGRVATVAIMSFSGVCMSCTGTFGIRV